MFSDLGISVGEDEKDIAKVNYGLKTAIRNKEEQLRKEEHNLAQAKRDYNKVLHELKNFNKDFETKYSLKSRLQKVIECTEKLKEHHK